MSRKINKDKMFIVKTYVMATCASQAIRKSKGIKPDDVWIDEDWKKGNATQLASAIGFETKNEE